MPRRSGSSARAQALVRAAEAVARRDAERIAREKAVQAALAEFFHSKGEIERIDAEARKAALPFERVARDAVCALDRLGESRAGIAELTGLPGARVREYLVEEAGPKETTRPTTAQQALPALGDGKPSDLKVPDVTEAGREPHQPHLR
jgi:hypothetical protein